MRDKGDGVNGVPTSGTETCLQFRQRNQYLDRRKEEKGEVGADTEEVK